MIIQWLMRYFSGKVSFKVSGGFSERLINLCAAHGLILWGFKKSGEGFEASVSAGDYKRLKELSKKANVDVVIKSKKGFIFKAGKYKSRFGLMLGIAAFAVILIGSQNVVWSIDVKGNSTVRTEVILSELEEVGIKPMVFIPNIDFKQKAQEALLKIPQLSWMAINRNGCNLSISVTERKLKPAIEDEEPCHVIAEKTGLILYMEVYNGTKLVKEKHTVLEGDMLVSGDIIRKDGTSVTVHADAKVIAEVQLEKSLSVDIAQLSKEYTGDRKTRRYLTLDSLKIPLFVATPISGKYDINKSSEPICIFGWETPFNILSMEYRFYEEKEETMSVEDARKVLEDSFRVYEATELKDSAVISRTPVESLKNDVLTITMKYVAEQNIAKLLPIGEAENKNALSE